jgi:hypothetical protein
MADGAWAAALVGGAVGVGGTLGATFLNHWLQNRRAHQLDEARKTLLRDMLGKGDEWRTLETLQRVIGANEETTIRLLLEVGARGSERGKPVWGLISRNPLPERTPD